MQAYRVRHLVFTSGAPPDRLLIGYESSGSAVMGLGP